MKKILGIFILNVILMSLYGATQVPDICIVKRDSIHQDTLLLFVFPLEDYFIQQDSRDLGDFKSCESNSCNRGYQAVWFTESDSLFLYNLQGCNAHMSWCDESSMPSLSAIFGDKCVNERVFADWVWGRYRLFDGVEIPYVKKQMFYSENYIKVKRGKIKKNKRYINVKPRRKSFAITTNTPQFIAFYLQENLNWKALPNRGVDEWIGEIEIKVKKNGRSEIKLITNATDRTIYRTETELSRCFQKLRWFRYYKLGKRIEVEFSVKLKFDLKNQEVILIK